LIELEQLCDSSLIDARFIEALNSLLDSSSSSSKEEEEQQQEEEAPWMIEI